MTAHRRTRKNKSKRSTTDVDPYTERYRRSSDAAKAARDAARSRAEGAGGEAGSSAVEGLGREAQAHRPEERVESSFRNVAGGKEGDQVAVVLDGQARIRSVSLVKEGGTGYILEVGKDDPRLQQVGLDTFSLGPFDESDLVPLNEVNLEDYGLGVGKYFLNDSELEDLERYVAVREEVLRPEATPDAEALGQRGAEGAAEELPEVAAPEPVAEAHLAFFEAEVNGLPTHVDTQDCTCDIGEAHWIELGEN